MEKWLHREDMEKMPEKPVLWVIGGTTEGRKLVEYLSRCGADVYVSLATEYGLSLLAKQENIQVRAERLSEEEMAAFLNQYKPDCVIDASHPYAQKVTASLYSACLQTKTDYVRLLRPASETAIYLRSKYRQAAEILSGIKGKAFLACGSKEIEAFTVVPILRERFYVRILPAATVCRNAWPWASATTHFLYAGPFSQELNAAMLKATGADIMVTKDSET
jgi:precorrin-6x reductase